MTDTSRQIVMSIKLRAKPGKLGITRRGYFFARCTGSVGTPKPREAALEMRLPAARPMLPIPLTAMRTRADFHKCHVGQGGARIQRPLISGSQVRALIRPPPSLPKPAVNSSQAERPFLRPFPACGGLRYPVSARRHRHQVPFGASVSAGKNPVPNSTRHQVREELLNDRLLWAGETPFA
jgi:hypothetical protein